MGPWIEMQVRGLILDPTNEGPIVILREGTGEIYLPIWIGAFEANAIAMAVEAVESPRPMTHDLLRSVLGALEVDLSRVEIHSLDEGTYHARLLLRVAGGGERVVDSRPSDAIALALRMGAKIWVAREVLQQALSTAKATAIDDEERLRQWLENARPEDLGKYSM